MEVLFFYIINNDDVHEQVKSLRDYMIRIVSMNINNVITNMLGCYNICCVKRSEHPMFCSTKIIRYNIRSHNICLNKTITTIND